MARGGTGEAFCPAHVTGFFKAEESNGGSCAGEDGRGSLGAGFSIALGVRTRVSGARIERGGGSGGPGRLRISTTGYAPEDTVVSREVVAEFERAAGGARLSADILHEIGVPVGYGLGCSSAAALSLALALGEALGCGMQAEQAGRIAHRAEIRCRTGLGDVLAAYHGGFEVRTRAGAPGVGRVRRAGAAAAAAAAAAAEGPGGSGGGGGGLEGTAAVIGCFSPVSTRRFIDERLAGINGLGGAMVERMAGPGGDMGAFQEMSMEFARHIGVVTPRMAAAAAGLRGAGIKCGVALFGETVFALAAGEAGEEEEEKAAEILAGCGCDTIRTKIGGAAKAGPPAGARAAGAACA